MTTKTAAPRKKTPALTPQRLVDAVQQAVAMGITDAGEIRWWARSVFLTGELVIELIQQQEHSEKRRLLSDLIDDRAARVKDLFSAAVDAARAGAVVEFIRLAVEHEEAQRLYWHIDLLRQQVTFSPVGGFDSDNPHPEGKLYPPAEGPLDGAVINYASHLAIESSLVAPDDPGYAVILGYARAWLAALSTGEFDAVVASVKGMVTA